MHNLRMQIQTSLKIKQPAIPMLLSESYFEALLQAARTSKDELELQERANDALKRDVDRYQKRSDLETEAHLSLPCTLLHKYVQ